MIKRLLSSIPTTAIALAAVSLVALSPAAASASSASSPIGAYTNQGTYRFVSAPHLRPPQISADVVPKNFKALARGDFLLANFRELGSPAKMVGQGGPMIFDKYLQPVWYLPRGVNVYVNNLSEGTYKGKPVLSWWQGVLTKLGDPVSGSYVIVNQQYKRIATLTGTGGWIVDFHELQISGKYAYVTGYRTVAPVDLTTYGGPANGALLDSGVLQFDLSQHGTPMVHAWSMYQDYGIPLSESALHGPPPSTAATPWDAYHINSIQVLGPTEFLISLRNTWAVYLVNNGAVTWTLGGSSASNFFFGHGAAFEWQHDAELHGNVHGTFVLTLFDDACCRLFPPGGKPNGPSRGLVLKVDPPTATAIHGTVTLLRQYLRPGGPKAQFHSGTEGNTQLLPNGNVVIGWGGTAVFSEYSSAGKLLFDAVLPPPDDTYRAYLSNWIGLPPASAIAHAVRHHGGTTSVYVSWNGATQVARWRLLAGSSAKHLAVVAKQSRISFETVLTTTQSDKVYELQALGSRGKVLGTSKAF